MKKEMNYLIFKIIADAVREGRETKDVKDIDNLDSAIAYKVLKRHNIDPEAAWMFEDREYLDCVDDDLYSMMDISSALIETQKESLEYVLKKADEDYGVDISGIDVFRDILEMALTMYMFHATDYLKYRNIDEEEENENEK